ncbi:hypothetical protein [Streptomyces sp. NPDC006645]|uniref:hypothetical protein n=1 Tax=unclassified Streptomyces TaxID=2593676 RepID=UPI0033A38055
MRLVAFLVLTAVAVTVAIVGNDYSWLLAPVCVFLFLGVSPFWVSKSPKAVRRPVTGAAAGTAVGAAGAVTAASWWAEGAHAHGAAKGDTADASGGDGGGDGGCGGCGGCGCG